MPLIHDIQSELLNDEKDVGSILRKFKVLASKLEVDVLEDWVTHEIEGYPPDVPVPDYRKTSINYVGDFVGSGWRYKDTTIPSLLITKHIGEEFIDYDIRKSLPVIDWYVKNKGDEKIGISHASNLKLILQGYGKIYEGMDLIEIKGIIDIGAFIGIQQAVLTKILNLILKIEKEIPSVADINIGGKGAKVSASESDAVGNIFQQTINRNVSVTNTNINTTGDGNVLQVEVGGSFVHALIKKGIDKKGAEELEKIVQKNPKTPDEKSIANWVEKMFKQGNEWVRGMPKEVATATIIEMIKKFF